VNGLLLTLSVMDGSVMNVVCKVQVCYEWRLLLTGLL